MMPYDEVVSNLKGRINMALKSLYDKDSVLEIRIRSMKPLTVFRHSREEFVYNDGTTGVINNNKVVVVTPNEIEENISSICHYSFHQYQDQINNGYITLAGGHRAGICGTAVYNGSRIENIKNISFVNIRIADARTHCSDELFDKIFKNGICSVLLVGPPLSGKTTILRDIIRNICDMRRVSPYKVSVIDERGEIAAMSNGIAYSDIGVCADVFNGYKKHDAVDIAIRSMSPQIIALDEIGDENDADSIKCCLNAGVKIIATAHSDSFCELMQREHIAELINRGAFEKIVILSPVPGEVKKIIETKSDKVGKSFVFNNDNYSMFPDRERYS